MIAFKNILCPTDLSDASVRALTYAAAFARWYGAQLTVLHAVPTFDPIVVAPGTFNGPAQMVVPRSREEIRDQVCQIKVVISGLPSVVVEQRDAAFQQALDRAISSAALAVRRSLQRRRLKPFHHRASQPPVTGLDDRGRHRRKKLR